MWKANGRTDGRMTDAYPWQKLTWPMARWAKKNEMLTNFENFDFFLKNFELEMCYFFIFIILKFFENFEILWNFLTLISKKQFLCNKKPYCTLVPRNFIHWFCTRVQYDYLLHRNWFLLINMLENGMSRVLLLANRKTVK